MEDREEDLDHREIPYNDGGIPALEVETYELLRKLALSYGERKPIEIANQDLFTRERTNPRMVHCYGLEWKLEELGLSYELTLIDAPDEPRAHGQAALVISEAVGDEFDIRQHIYTPKVDSERISYQMIPLQHTQAYIDEQNAWHAEIDANRPPTKKGELRVYTLKHGGSMEEMAQERELRLHFLRRAEEKFASASSGS